MPEATIQRNVALIGAGQMAEALIGGFLESGLLASSRLRATDPDAGRRDLVGRRFGIAVGVDNRDAAAWADVVILAVKPQTLPAVVDDLAAALDGKLVISIAAGVPLRQIAERLKSEARLVRVMPNAPALLRAGVSALSSGPNVSGEDAQLARRLLEAVGRVVVVNESLMDAVTGLSGSGPAYAFLMIEALADGGVKMGLPRDVAVTLAAQTLAGAAKMWIETGEHPGRLKDRVASPGGTTIAGLHELEKGGFRSVLMKAVEAATERSKALGRSCS